MLLKVPDGRCIPHICLSFYSSEKFKQPWKFISNRTILYTGDIVPVFKGYLISTTDLFISTALILLPVAADSSCNVCIDLQTQPAGRWMQPSDRRPMSNSHQNSHDRRNCVAAQLDITYLRASAPLRLFGDSASCAESLPQVPVSVSGLFCELRRPCSSPGPFAFPGHPYDR